MIPATSAGLDLEQTRRWMNGPAWRWRLAEDYCRSLRLPNMHSDEHVRHAAQYIRVLNAGDDGPSRAACAYPAVAQARALWNDRALQEKLVIMILGGLPRDAMAQRLGTSAEVIETAEVLFFDVRSCRGASDWIDCHVIRRELRSGSVEAGVRYRLAFYGGPRVAERILDCTDHEWLLQLKALAALEIPMQSSRESLQLQRLYLDHQRKSERLQLDREKFQTRAEQESRRLELAEQRMKLRAAKREEKERRQRERQRLAEFKAAVRKQFEEAEQRDRIDRAQNSPLAKLRWRSTATAVRPPTASNRTSQDTTPAPVLSPRPVASRAAAATVSAGTS